MRKAMITIEILISMMILFIVILASVNTIKHLKMIYMQQIHHENLFVEVLNIKQLLSSDICKKFKEKRGVSNGYEYAVKCHKLTEKRSYIKDTERELYGNHGNTMVEMFRVDLVVKNRRFKNMQKVYQYYKVVTKNL